MAIWLYKYQEIEPNEMEVRSKNCVFCKAKMQTIYSETSQFFDRHKSINMCPVCGWWTIWQQHSNLLLVDDRKAFNLYGTSAILKQLDLTNLEQPIEEVEQYLITRFEERHSLHPRLLEEVVTSVFRNLGYQSTITSYHKDGGIDVILHDNKESEIGIQVKRYKDSIQVNQIREFAGSLIENGMTNGIFVTTSRFQKGVFKTADNFLNKGLKIELIDAHRLYDALKLSMINRFKNYEDFIEIIGDVELSTIYENETGW